MLVDLLKNELRWDMKALHHKPGDQFMRYLQEYAWGMETVFSRGHVSEMIYGELWRGGNPFLPWQQNMLDQYAMHNMVSIYCLPDEDEMLKRYQARRYSQQINPAELAIVRERFAEHWLPISEKGNVLVYQSKDLDELGRLIETLKEMRGERR